MRMCMTNITTMQKADKLKQWFLLITYRLGREVGICAITVAVERMICSTQGMCNCFPKGCIFTAVTAQLSAGNFALAAVKHRTCCQSSVYQLTHSFTRPNLGGYSGNENNPWSEQWIPSPERTSSSQPAHKADDNAAHENNRGALCAVPDGVGFVLAEQTPEAPGLWSRAPRQCRPHPRRHRHGQLPHREGRVCRQRGRRQGGHLPVLLGFALSGVGVTEAGQCPSRTNLAFVFQQNSADQVNHSASVSRRINFLILWLRCKL